MVTDTLQQAHQTATAMKSSAIMLVSSIDSARRGQNAMTEVARRHATLMRDQADRVLRELEHA
jgi:hypothetical protein